MRVWMISQDKGLPMSQVGILNLFWVKDASFCCKDDIVWAKLIIVESWEEIGELATLETLGKVYEATRIEDTIGGTLGL